MICPICKSDNLAYVAGGEFHCHKCGEYFCTVNPCEDCRRLLTEAGIEIPESMDEIKEDIEKADARYPY